MVENEACGSGIPEPKKLVILRILNTRILEGVENPNV